MQFIFDLKDPRPICRQSFIYYVPKILNMSSDLEHMKAGKRRWWNIRPQQGFDQLPIKYRDADWE